MNPKKPEWLRIRVGERQAVDEVQQLLKKLSLNTVCDEANCPNRMECFNRRTATFMILGSVCTRNCTFCNVTKGKPETVQPDEPANLAAAASELGLKHVVVTSVTRDDLPDGGAAHFAAVIEELRKLNNKLTVEVLIPDFQGSAEAFKTVISARPDILNHNVETVPSLYPEVRPMADYRRSLRLLADVKKLDPSVVSKTGIMVGLGEAKEEVIQTMKDLRAVDCDVLTIGQYMAPSPQHHPVVEYIHPDVFNEYKDIGMSLGFKYVASAPLVRSSYHADDVIDMLH